MPDTPFTPGPWRQERNRPNRIHQANTHPDADYALIAYVASQADDADLANARLIAAAPTLLHACRQALAALADPYTAVDDSKRPTVRLIEQAIVDATGQLP